jgi:hypothetical protein
MQADKYQRNNKRGGLKNLRCFPTCSPAHKERGFCGRPVLLTVTHPASFTASRRLMAYADFAEASQLPAFQLNQVIKFAALDSSTRTRLQPMMPWVPGHPTATSPTQTVFEFNKERRGWHYSWTSNKHSCDSEHVMQAFVFERLGEHTTTSMLLRCVAVATSPRWILFCRRRKRFTLEPRAPVAATSATALSESSSSRKRLKISTPPIQPSPVATPSIAPLMSSMMMCMLVNEDEHTAVSVLSGLSPVGRGL